MEIIKVNIADLRIAEYNPREIAKREFESLKKSIAEFGFVEPIVVNRHLCDACGDRNNVIIGGHQRVAAATALAITEVPAVLVDVHINQEKKLNLALNRIHGEWDETKLATLIQELYARPQIDLGATGFTAAEIDKYLDRADAAEDDFDADKEYEKSLIAPLTQVGEVINLGPHRLICGDSTDPEVYKKLLQGESPHLIFTDPPYNVDYNYAKYKDGRKVKFDKIFNDNLPEHEFVEFLRKVFALAHQHSTETASMYSFCASKTYPLFRKAMDDADWYYSQTIIWLKERFVLSLGQTFHRAYEPILYGWKNGSTRQVNYQITNATNFWNLNKGEFKDVLDLWFEQRDKASDYEHPTQKPIKLGIRALAISTSPGDIVLDCFGGSGSTMMACEKMARVARMIELDPAYCDVIRKRWERHQTG